MNEWQREKPQEKGKYWFYGRFRAGNQTWESGDVTVAMRVVYVNRNNYPGKALFYTCEGVTTYNPWRCFHGIFAPYKSDTPPAIPDSLKEYAEKIPEGR